MSPLSYRAVSARGRHRSCRPEARTNTPWPTERRNDLLRPDVADFHPFQPLQAGHVDLDTPGVNLIVNMSGVANERGVLQHLHGPN